MNRRDFLQLIGAAGAGLVIPFAVSAELVIVDVEFVGDITQNMKFERSADGVTVSLDTNDIWKAVRLIDDNGRQWSTPDQSKTWQCGLMSFTTGDIEDVQA